VIAPVLNTKVQEPVQLEVNEAEQLKKELTGYPTPDRLPDVLNDG
jgi:hypothetical protein